MLDFTATNDETLWVLLDGEWSDLSCPSDKKDGVRLVGWVSGESGLVVRVSFILFLL